MCSLLVEVTHFNFRTNLMNCIVAYLSKRSWGEVRGHAITLQGKFCR